MSCAITTMASTCISCKCPFMQQHGITNSIDTGTAVEVFFNGGLLQRYKKQLLELMLLDG